MEGGRQAGSSRGAKWTKQHSVTATLPKLQKRCYILSIANHLRRTRSENFASSCPDRRIANPLSCFQCGLAPLHFSNTNLASRGQKHFKFGVVAFDDRIRWGNLQQVCCSEADSWPAGPRYILKHALSWLGDSFRSSLMVPLVGDEGVGYDTHILLLMCDLANGPP